MLPCCICRSAGSSGSQNQWRASRLQCSASYCLLAQAALHKSIQAVPLLMTLQAPWQGLLASCAGACCLRRLHHQSRWRHASAL